MQKLEAIMAETAVGLFEHSGTADLLADALRAEGFPAESIRVLAKPSGMSVDSATSSPITHFGAALRTDLRSMGATEAECDAYIAGVESGNALVFVTVSADEADKAISLMQAYQPLELEEFAGAAPMLPGIHVGEAATGNITFKEDRVREKTGGARVFTW